MLSYTIKNHVVNVNQISNNIGIGINASNNLSSIKKIGTSERLFSTSLKLNESKMINTKSNSNLQQMNKISTNASAIAAPTAFPKIYEKVEKREKENERENEKEEEEYQYENSFIGMTGAEILHEMLLRHNVKHIFGYSGSAILSTLDVIFKKGQIKFIVPRHEQGAGHMAEGYARASGKVGVAIVTSGPGATNIVTPLQDAFSDGIPLVVFSGQVPTTAIGSDAFQEADMVGISRSCTKWNCIIKDIHELPRRINEAFYIATSGRPGPVLIDIPKNISDSIFKKPSKNGMKIDIPSIKSLNYPSSPSFPPSSSNRNQIQNYNNTIIQNMEQMEWMEHMKHIKNAANLINNAKRPVIYAGAGLLNHPEGSKILSQLVEKANIPVTTTLQGLGLYDEEKPLSLHMLGMHGSVYANLAMQKADVILALGARFDDRVTGNVSKFAPNAKKAALQSKGGIIHFEISQKNIDKIVKATEAIQGDVTENLKLMLPMIKMNERTEWKNIIMNWKKKYPFIYKKSEEGNPLKPQEAIEELNRQLKNRKNDVIITTGVGQHQMWTAQYYRWKTPHSIISSGGLGTMGFGLPASIGAKIAKPEKMVIDIDGDSSFSMTLTELATVGQNGIGVKILLLNNSFQGMVKQWQDLFYGERHSGTEMSNPDFVKIAEAMKLKGMRCRDKKELPKKIKQFLETDKPVLLEVLTDSREHVLPMVPAGNGLDEMVIGDRSIDEEDLNM